MSNIEIVSARLDCRTSHQLDLQEWLGSSATPPHVITVEAIVPPELDDLTAALVIEELIKPQVPEICAAQIAFTPNVTPEWKMPPELATTQWWVDNCYVRDGGNSLIQHNGNYRNRDAIQPTSRQGDRASFTLIPQVYAEMAYFQRALWTLELPYLSLQDVPIYRMWMANNVIHIHLKSREAIPDIAVESIFDWLHLGTPIDLMAIGEIACRYYPTHKGSGGTIYNIEIAIPLNGTGLLVGNVITTEDDSPTPTEPPIPSCLNCRHFGSAIPATREDPGEDSECQHLDRESFPSVDTDAENEALNQGENAIWQLYAQDCPGYEYQDPQQAQEPDDLPLLTEQDQAIAHQLEADLLQYGPGKVFAYPLLSQRADWIPPDQLLPSDEELELLQRLSKPGAVKKGRDELTLKAMYGHRSDCKFLTPWEYASLSQHSVRKTKLRRQVTGSGSPIPKLTTIIVSTPTGERTFQFNGGHMDELVPAAGGKVKRVEVRSPKGEEWYNQAHLEVMHCLYALENAIRRMVGISEASWDEATDLEDFGVPLVGIDPDAPEPQVFE